MLNIISKSYCSRLNTGPKKVAINLIKGLELLKYPYAVNKRPDACQRLWIHDDVGALKKLRILDSSIKVLAGPNLFILPQEIPAAADLSRAVYLQHSEWVKNLWLDRGFKICPIEVWPVGIDTDDFLPSSQKKEFVLLYFKQRSEAELKIAEEVLNKKHIKYKILRYGRYSEKNYKAVLAQSRYVLWLGIHESQGIALEEALSADVPVLVCDVVKTDRWQAFGVSKTQEKPYTITTAAPYFDRNCGLKIEDLKDLAQAVDEMESRLSDFSPRQYVEQNLGLEKQALAFLEIYNRYFGLTVASGYNGRLLKEGEWINAKPFARAKFFLKDIYKSVRQ